jgi:hypothetical protein
LKHWYQYAAGCNLTDTPGIEKWCRFERALIDPAGLTLRQVAFRDFGFSRNTGAKLKHWYQYAAGCNLTDTPEKIRMYPAIDKRKRVARGRPGIPRASRFLEL